MEDTEFGRRRRWSADEKRAIVDLSLDPASSVAEVASSFDLVPAQIYGWRRELREMAEALAREDAAPVFLPVIVEPRPPVTLRDLPASQDSAMLPDEMVQLVMEVRGVPVRVAHGANPALVASVIAALKAAR